MYYKGEQEIAERLKSGRRSADALARELNLNIDTVRRALESLKDKGFVELRIEESEAATPADEFNNYANTGEMPEYSVFRKSLSGTSVADLSDAEKSIGLRWAKVKGWVDIEAGRLVAKADRFKVEEANKALISARESAARGKLSGGDVETELLKRNLITRQKRKTIYASPTGKDASQLVRDAASAFDVGVAAADAPIGRRHPLSKMINRIRHIFAELGFDEMDGSMVETSFWNFDALFQPQDHPARELADTFYLQGEGELPKDAELVGRVKKAHERGWRYKWSEAEAKRLVLRTHTTALSARYLADMKSTPKKYFAVGRVFRNEATDYKHLAEFHQVEGIIAWEDANFRDLLGILKEFYLKLGFEKTRFVPSYFPYTEPSLQVEVYFEPKKQWLELGGAGIFRPEVSLPLCKKYPVLAWGLSLERPLMILMGMDDIRTFYKNDFDWLKEARL